MCVCSSSACGTRVEAQAGERTSPPGTGLRQPRAGHLGVGWGGGDRAEKSDLQSRAQEGRGETASPNSQAVPALPKLRWRLGRNQVSVIRTERGAREAFALKGNRIVWAPPCAPRVGRSPGTWLLGRRLGPAPSFPGLRNAF